MVTKFYIVPTHIAQILLWISIAINLIAAGLFWRSKVVHDRTGRLMKEKTKELEVALERVNRDVATLDHEIEEVRRLKLL